MVFIFFGYPYPYPYQYCFFFLCNVIIIHIHAHVYAHVYTNVCFFFFFPTKLQRIIVFLMEVLFIQLHSFKQEKKQTIMKDLKWLLRLCKQERASLNVTSHSSVTKTKFWTINTTFKQACKQLSIQPFLQLYIQLLMLIYYLFKWM